MPKVGQEPKLTGSPGYEATVTLLNELRDFWIEKSQGHDPVQFSRQSVVALTQLGAILAVDVGMSLDQFLAVCQATFAETYKRAPRFS